MFLVLYSIFDDMKKHLVIYIFQIQIIHSIFIHMKMLQKDINISHFEFDKFNNNISHHWENSP